MSREKVIIILLVVIALLFFGAQLGGLMKSDTGEGSGGYKKGQANMFDFLPEVNINKQDLEKAQRSSTKNLCIMSSSGNNFTIKSGGACIFDFTESKMPLTRVLNLGCPHRRLEWKLIHNEGSLTERDQNPSSTSKQIKILKSGGVLTLICRFSNCTVKIEGL